MNQSNYHTNVGGLQNKNGGATGTWRDKYIDQEYNNNQNQGNANYY